MNSIILLVNHFAKRKNVALPFYQTTQKTETKPHYIGIVEGEEEIP